MKITLLALFLSMAFNYSIFSPKDSRRKIIVTNKQYVVETYISTKANIKIDAEKFYCWYDNDKLHITQGGYDKYLVDGEYVERRYASNNLVCKGAYDKGLKDGNWTYWYDNGRIKERSCWKNGQRHGETILYANSGEVVEQKYYRLGIMITDNTSRRVTNRKGFNKVKSIFKDINIFRKKPK